MSSSLNPFHSIVNETPTFQIWWTGLYVGHPCLPSVPLTAFKLGPALFFFTFLVACALRSIIHTVILHKSLKSYVAG